MTEYTKNMVVIAATTDHPRQFSIRRENFKGPVWNDAYIEFSGFFGDVGPHVFAAAPELLDALEALIDADGPDYIRSKYWDNARAAIAKARGQE